ncbi:hypothetical protein VDF70_12055 [Xanthomonas campestris pv. raphani]|uniref:hypothetical protein n=1 Tax=Xanthomonas campestris TaxID=339 RepID=UPI002B22A9B5|nr:hypothetical protein [Xanthomonas campestris]MEA9759786.1 hypothetical protein [Xanthomonas campestris pv. raphani]
MEDIDDSFPTKRSGGDNVLAVARSGLSAIPLAGGLAVEVLQRLFQAPLDKRREEWLNLLAGRIELLERRGIDIEQLSNNDSFVSAVLSASQVALKTHTQEKLDALRAALTNVAIGQSPGDALEHIFLDLIESLPALEISLLRFAATPFEGRNAMTRTLRDKLEESHPDIKSSGAVYELLWLDLAKRGLITVDNLQESPLALSMKTKTLTSDIGARFLKFITDPVEND